MDTTETIATTAGEVPLYECRLAVAGREIAVLHTGAVVTVRDENRYLSDQADRLPYGVVLWPGALALAHEIAVRAAEFRGTRVLELGAGTGLPGIVAAAAGASVVQTDRQELALAVCRRNAERNGAAGIEVRAADWSAWTDAGQYDWILGSDILYAEGNHVWLRYIFERNLSAGGRLLLSDPYRADSLGLLEGMERAGWRVLHTKWTIGEGKAARPVAVFELTRPVSSSHGRDRDNRRT